MKKITIPATLLKAVPIPNSATVPSYSERTVTSAAVSF